MFKLISIVFVLLSLFSLCEGQIKKRCSTIAQPKLSKSEPSVFIAIERIGKRVPLENGVNNEGVWLRLKNNTCWPITIEMSGVPSVEYGDARLFYEIISDEKVVIDERCHVCSFNKLGPGKSLVFSLPRDYLSKGDSLRIEFNFEWQNEDDVLSDREIKNYVYFNSSRLPDSVDLIKK